MNIWINVFAVLQVQWPWVSDGPHVDWDLVDHHCVTHCGLWREFPGAICVTLHPRDFLHPHLSHLHLRDLLQAWQSIQMFFVVVFTQNCHKILIFDTYLNWYIRNKTVLLFGNIDTIICDIRLFVVVLWPTKVNFVLPVSLYCINTVYTVSLVNINIWGKKTWATLYWVHSVLKATAA